MATVRHLGLFALPNLPFGGTELEFLQRRLRCPQPAEVFTADQLGVQTYTVYPASLEGSLYTEVGISRAMLWLWRIKSFTVTGTAVLEDSSYDESYNVEIGPFIAPNRIFNDLSEPLEKEYQKVCDCGMFYGQEQSAGYEDSEAGSHRVAVSIGALSTVWANYPTVPRIRIGQVGQRIRISTAEPTIDKKREFYIPVLVEVLIRGGDSLARYESGVTFSGSASAPNNPQDQGISWQINDALGDIGAPFLYGSTSTPGTSFSISGTITITASEYWPYDPGDGLGPIYDSATGAQLRGFPS